MAMLGGGGPQTAFGMLLWNHSVGLVAGVGGDLPDSAREWLANSGVDTTGVRSTDLPTPRAWQLMEADGSRRQEWRVPTETLAPQLSRTLDALPPGYRSARGFHFGVHPDDLEVRAGLSRPSFAADLRALGGIVSIEPFRSADHRPSPEHLRALLSAADIFSPNMVEAKSLVGEGEPRDLARRLLDAGARVVSLRLGQMGALVVDGATGKSALISPVPVTVVNQVGAGNAFCGGFLAGWVQSGDIVHAGRCGAVAASFLLERETLPLPDEATRREARQRLDALSRHVALVTI